MLRQELRNKVVNVEYADGRFMMIKLKGKHKDLITIQMCVPTSQYEDEEVK